MQENIEIEESVKWIVNRKNQRIREICTVKTCEKKEGKQMVTALVF